MTGRNGFVAIAFVLTAIVVPIRRLPASQAVDSGRLDGDAARGQAVFEGKGACLDCHRVGVRGSRFGPDLTDIGARAGIVPLRGRGAARGEPAGRGGAADPAAPERAREELERSLLDPAAEILPTNRTVKVVTIDGETITARVLNQDTFSMQLIDTKERLFTLQKSNVREFTWIRSSSMPSYRDKLTLQERADLIAYLLSLKGRIQ